MTKMFNDILGNKCKVIPGVRTEFLAGFSHMRNDKGKTVLLF